MTIEIEKALQECMGLVKQTEGACAFAAISHPKTDGKDGYTFTVTSHASAEDLVNLIANAHSRVLAEMTPKIAETYNAVLSTAMQQAYEQANKDNNKQIN